MSRPLVCHYGPPPGGHGGMSSVLEAYATLPLQRYRFEFRGTWAPDAALWGLRPTLEATGRLLTDRAPLPITHVHLSEKGSFVREGGLARLAARRGERVVASMHGADLAPFLAAHPRLSRGVLRKLDAVVALGSETAKLIEDHVGGGARVVVVPNPIEVPPTTTPAGEQPPTALFAGDVGLRKGADVLLEAWPIVRRAVPDARLVVAGPLRDVARRELDGIEWLGGIGRRDVVALLEKARIAVLPSRAEVMPMFILEAMIRARPAISTPVGEIASMLDDADLLVPPGNGAALAATMIRLLTDAPSCTRIGSRLRARAIATTSPPVVASALEDLYDSLLAEDR